MQESWVWNKGICCSTSGTMSFIFAVSLAFQGTQEQCSRWLSWMLYIYWVCAHSWGIQCIGTLNHINEMLKNLHSLSPKKYVFSYYASQKTNLSSTLERCTVSVLLGCLYANVFGKIVNHKNCQFLFLEDRKKNNWHIVNSISILSISNYSYFYQKSSSTILTLMNWDLFYGPIYGLFLWTYNVHLKKTFWNYRVSCSININLVKIVDGVQNVYDIL